MELTKVKSDEIKIAIEIINAAKFHLKQQGINQWQTGYPDYACIQNDVENGKGFFITDKEKVYGYVCVDFDGENAYDNLNGKWETNGKYVVVHRMAFIEDARGKGMSDIVFHLVEKLCIQQGIYSFRVDTDEDNKKMQHILKKNGFTYRGTILFDNSEKIAFDKTII